MVKESTCSAGDSRDARSIPGAGRSPGEGNGNLFSTLLSGESHGLGLVGYSSWMVTESDMTGHSCTPPYL